MLQSYVFAQITHHSLLCVINELEHHVFTGYCKEA